MFNLYCFDLATLFCSLIEIAPRIDRELKHKNCQIYLFKKWQIKLFFGTKRTKFRFQIKVGCVLNKTLTQFLARNLFLTSDDRRIARKKTYTILRAEKCRITL